MTILTISRTVSHTTASRVKVGRQRLYPYTLSLTTLKISEDVAEQLPSSHTREGYKLQQQSSRVEQAAYCHEFAVKVKET